MVDNLGKKTEQTAGEIPVLGFFIFLIVYLWIKLEEIKHQIVEYCSLFGFEAADWGQ